MYIYMRARVCVCMCVRLAKKSNNMLGLYHVQRGSARHSVKNDAETRYIRVPGNLFPFTDQNENL